MKIAEIEIVDEFTPEDAYSIINMLKDNSKKIEGVGIEAYYNPNNKKADILDFIQSIKNILSTCNDCKQDIKASFVAIGIKEECFKIVVKFFDKEYTFATPIFS